MGEPGLEPELQLNQPAKKLEYSPSDPDQPSLSPRKKLESFQKARREIGSLRAFLYADQHTGLTPNVCTEAQIREAFRHINRGEHLGEVAGFFQARDKNILSRFEKLTESSDTARFVSGAAGAAVAARVGSTALKEGLGSSLRGLGGTLLAPLYGFYSAFDILKGKGRPELRFFTKLKGETRQLTDFTKSLICSRDAKKDPLTVELLTNREELVKNPETLKKAAQKLAKFKQTALRLGLTDKNLSFTAEVSENDQWTRKTYHMRDVVNTIAGFEDKVFKAAEGNPDLQKELIYTSLGLGSEPKNLKISEESAVDLEAKLLRQAFETRWKQAVIYGTASTVVATISLNILANQIDKVWAAIAPAAHIAPKVSFGTQYLNTHSGGTLSELFPETTASGKLGIIPEITSKGTGFPIGTPIPKPAPIPTPR